MIQYVILKNVFKLLLTGSTNIYLLSALSPERERERAATISSACIHNSIYTHTHFMESKERKRQKAFP